MHEIHELTDELNELLDRFEAVYSEGEIQYPPRVRMFLARVKGILKFIGLHPDSDSTIIERMFNLLTMIKDILGNLLGLTSGLQRLVEPKLINKTMSNILRSYVEKGTVKMNDITHEIINIMREIGR